MPPVIRHKNRTVFIDLTPLVEGALEETHLTADVSASAGTLTVADIDGFAVNQILLIGELGSEKSEIIKTHASTAPSGTTVTLAANTEFAHSAGTKVYVLSFDQVEISHASTAGGSKSVLSTESIQADQLIQTYEDTTESSGFYFARFKESIGSTFGSYSDAAPYGGWASDSVGYMIDRALDNLNLESLDETITREFCYSAINEGLRYVKGKQIRWPHYQNLNAIVGQTVRGQHIYDVMPTDIYDKYSHKSIHRIRIGDDLHLRYLDPLEFEEALDETKWTQVRTQASAADTTLEVDNSYDFADSGTLVFFKDGTKYSITYTGITRDDANGGTAVFSGIPASGTGSITVTIPVDTYIWQDVEEGEPNYYTIRNGKIEVWEVPDSSHDDMNIYMDYDTVATEVDSDGDTVDAHRFDMILDYLTWRIRMKKKKGGALDMTDGWFISFKEKLNDAIRTKGRHIKHKMAPKINRISYNRFGKRVRPLPESDN